MRLFLFVLFTSYVSVLQAQYFEGVVTYKTKSIIKKKSKYSEKGILELYGNIIEYYIKDGNYKIIRKYNGEIVDINTYSPINNRLYTEYPKLNYIYWTDCSYNTDSLVSLQLSDDKVNFNQMSCQIFTQQTTKTTITYLVTNELKIDPESFKNHHFGFWAQRLQATGGAVDVEVMEEYDGYDIIQTMSNVEYKKLSPEIWQINKKKEALPAPRELDSKAEPSKGFEDFYSCLNRKIKYPTYARRKNIEGKVYISFLLDEKAKISNVQIYKGLDSGIDSEAMSKFLKCDLPWTPAYYKGEPIKTEMILPITFKLHP